MKRNVKRQRKGFTIIEIMVVLVIIALLTTIVGPRLMSLPEKGRVTRAKIDMDGIAKALRLYKLDNGFYPSTEQGLEALVKEPTTDPIPMSWQPGGYLETKETLKDPWGKVYIYRSPGEDGADFDLISLGADGKEGGEGYDADIVFGKNK